MTEIREPHYRVDLPGEWEKADSLEEGTVVYGETGSNDTLSLTLLGMRPEVAAADEMILLRQYMDHRYNFERGHNENLRQTPPDAVTAETGLEGAWSAVDVESGRRIRHRVLLHDGLLADFRYVAFDKDEAEFDSRADAILGSAGAWK